MSPVEQQIRQWIGCLDSEEQLKDGASLLRKLIAAAVRDRKKELKKIKEVP